jgi:flagellar motor switch protein FliM
MSDVLSQDQVAALVAAAREGQLPDAPTQSSAPRRRRVRKIDFTRPSKFTTDQQRRLERALENFARTVSTRLSAELRVPMSVELIDIAQLTWSNALDEVPDASISAIVDVTPINGRILLTAERSLVLVLLERLLGGKGTERPPERHLTDVDLALTSRVFQTLLDELSISFNDMAELQFVLLELETQRAPAQLAPLSEPSLALTLEVKLGRVSSTMVLLLPHRALEPVLAAPPEEEEDAGIAFAVGEALGGVSVELRAEVGSVDLPLDGVLALKPGDVLRLGPSAGEGEREVTLFADSVPLHRARLGRNGRRRAVQITRRVEEGS